MDVLPRTSSFVTSLEHKIPASPEHKIPVDYNAAQYRLLQSFGDRREYCSLDDEDYITALSFDKTGDFLSVGDRAGRLVFFKYVASNNPYENFEEDSVIDKPHNLKYKRISSKDFSPKARFNPIEYEYLFDFQSHLKEFDYMKSELIDQKINFINWMNNNGSQMNLVSSNSKSIKLWKVSEKYSRRLNKKPSNINMEESFPKISVEYEPIYKSTLKQEFFKLHKYSINSISVAKNDEFMLTSDDLKIYLWSLGDPNKPYNIINKTPFDMDELSEVITCSTLSKKNDNVLLFGTSTGSLNLADMRIAGNCDKNCLEFKSKKTKGKEKTFFTDILASISSCQFSPNENLILGREYLDLKVWDIKNTKEPVLTIPLYSEIKNHLCKLYESEGIFDKFKVSISNKTKMALTGVYNDSFHLLNIENGENHQFHICNNDELNVKKLIDGGENIGNGKTEKVALNLNNKILHSEFHPKKNCFALACLNCLYVFGN